MEKFTSATSNLPRPSGITSRSRPVSAFQMRRTSSSMPWRKSSLAASNVTTSHRRTNRWDIRRKLLVVKTIAVFGGKRSRPSSQVASACSVMRSASLTIATFQPEPPMGRRPNIFSMSLTAAPSCEPEGISTTPPHSGSHPRSAARARAAAVFPDTAGTVEDECRRVWRFARLF